MAKASQLVQSSALLLFGCALGWALPAATEESPSVRASHAQPTPALDQVVPEEEPDCRDIPSGAEVFAEASTTNLGLEQQLALNLRVENLAGEPVLAALALEVVDVEGEVVVPEKIAELEDQIPAKDSVDADSDATEFVVPSGLPDGYYQARVTAAVTDVEAKGFPFLATSHVYFSILSGSLETMSLHDWINRSGINFGHNTPSPEDDQ